MFCKIDVYRQLPIIHSEIAANMSKKLDQYK